VNQANALLFVTAGIDFGRFTHACPSGCGRLCGCAKLTTSASFITSTSSADSVKYAYVTFSVSHCVAYRTSSKAVARLELLCLQRAQRRLLCVLCGSRNSFSTCWSLTSWRSRTCLAFTNVCTLVTSGSWLRSRANTGQSWLKGVCCCRCQTTSFRLWMCLMRTPLCLQLRD
jgi:hypothetical protein